MIILPIITASRVYVLNLGVKGWNLTLTTITCHTGYPAEQVYISEFRAPAAMLDLKLGKPGFGSNFVAKFSLFPFTGNLIAINLKSVGLGDASQITFVCTASSLFVKSCQFSRESHYLPNWLSGGRVDVFWCVPQAAMMDFQNWGSLGWVQRILVPIL